MPGKITITQAGCDMDLITNVPSIFNPIKIQLADIKPGIIFKSLESENAVAFVNTYATTSGRSMAVNRCGST